MIEVTPIAHGLLDPNPWNPNVMQEHILRAARESIQRFGMIDPPVVRKKGRRFEIIDGEHRWRACGDLGIIDIPCVVIKASDVEARKLTVILNDIKGRHDPDLLGSLLRELHVDLDDDEFAIALPYTAEELAALLASVTPIEPDPRADDAPPAPDGEPDSKPGDIYQLGRHRLACGDARDAELRAQLTDGDTAALLLTDPPYGISIVGSAGTATNFSNNGKGLSEGYNLERFKARPIIGDDEPFDPTHLLDLAPKMILWGANHYTDRLPKGAKWLVWDKKDGSFDGTDMGDAELAWTNLSGIAVRLINHTWQGLARAGVGERGPRVHPTQKPVDVMAWCIEQASVEPASVILDPYAGSGSILMAAERLGMTCYATELDPGYCDVIRRRYEEHTAR